MAQTSIQSFYGRRLPTKKPAEASAGNTTLGDGFTGTEANAKPLSQCLGSWHPQQEYDEVDIRDLRVGPGRVMLTGRIVNLHVQQTKGGLHPRPNGFIKLLLKDDTGIVSVGKVEYYNFNINSNLGQVKLWFAKVNFDVHIGQLVSLWTVHINFTDRASQSPSNCFLHVNLYPEGDRTCYFMSYSNADDGTQCKLPLNYSPGKPLEGLMTLKMFAEAGHEIYESKILLCVKSIGQRKKVTIKQSTPHERLTDKLEVLAFDDTSTTRLILWDASQCASASRWTPLHTILLLTAPSFKKSHPCQITISSTTCIELDPDIPDTAWLRAHAARASQRTHPNPPFPTGIFSVTEALDASEQILFRISDLDEWARASLSPANDSTKATTKTTTIAGNSTANQAVDKEMVEGQLEEDTNSKERKAEMIENKTIIGWLSLVVTELHLAKLHSRRELCSGECSRCGVVVFANSMAEGGSVGCRHCEADVALRLNPRIVGALVDETGSVAAGKLIWSDEAWAQLLGWAEGGLLGGEDNGGSSAAEKLARETPTELKAREHAMLFRRVLLLVGWSAEVGRLVVLRVST